MIGWAVLASPARAESVVVDYSFERPAVSKVAVGGAFYDRVTMPGLANCGNAGQPALPARGCRILLPCGTEIAGIRVITGEEVPLGSGYLVEPAAYPFPLSGDPAEARLREPDPVVYGSNQPFPDALLERIGTHGFRGYQILIVKLQPVRYVPAGGTLSYFPRLAVVVDTVAGGRTSSLYRGRIGDEAALRTRIDNPAAVGTYPATERHAGRGFQMLILAPPWLADAFQPLKEYHNARGLLTEIHTTDQVGGFDPNAVRDYLRARYLADGIEYVLIGADDDVLAARDVYVQSYAGGPVASDMPTDMYFGCLDGTWNYDGDAYWGEPTDGEGGGDVDLIAEVYVGRAAADTPAEVTRFVNKTIWYVDGYHAAPGNALMVGEYLGWYGGPLWGGDYMDELIDGSSANGYTTVGISTTDYLVETLYDRDWPGQSWPAAELITRINGGVHLINHLGHGSPDQAMKLYDSTILSALTNADLCFVYSQTCWAGRFDGFDCWAETMHVKTDYGAFALIMNSRYGWGVTEGTDGASQRFHREFWDAVFDEDLPELGRANQDSKEDNLYRINEECMRWCTYELNLFGDPSIRIRPACMVAGTVTLDRPKYACESTATVLVNDCGLNTDDNAIETVVVTIGSDSETAGEQVTLVETLPSSAKFEGAIVISTTDAVGVLLVAEGDTVTVTYVDADDGHGGSGIPVTATAVVDCTPPVISAVAAQVIDGRNATIAFAADEPARGTVHFGFSCGSLTETVTGSGYSTAPTVHLTGLDDNATYFYTVTTDDEAGNAATDDNGGACYAFVTPKIPYYFTELFTPGGNDLGNTSLIFTPDGSVDFYSACAQEITQLPTDPTGGTPVAFTYGGNDDYALVTLAGGATVSLYGVSYGTFYVGSNGYVTFGSGDVSPTETIARHFDRPRISAWFDDLNPAAGGSVTWKDCGDWVAVTYANVPEYGTGNSNTFQIEMFANGTITLSYLSMVAADGLAGLSAGNGVDPYYYETDLSDLGACGPRPPRVRNVVVSTAVDVGMTITLQAFDDGLPYPPGTLTYLITSLPSHGQLTDPWAGPITGVPYTLAGGGNQVAYQPPPGYWGMDPFYFKATDGGTPPEGGDSVTSVVTLTVGGPDWDPVAHDLNWATPITTPGDITLSASDPNGDPLTYIIETLPLWGSLSDPDAGLIDAVPYTLVGGNTVRYEPPFGQNARASFDFSARDATMGSNVATVTIAVGGAAVMYGCSLNSNPGWAVTPGSQWAFGQPTGHGGIHYGFPDPNGGATGANVYGVNLNGDYSTTPGGPYYLTVGPLDFTGVEEVTLKFQRWLNTDVRSYASASVEASNNGVDWVTLWQNPSNVAVTDNAWSQQSFDLSALADHEPAVYVRWAYRIRSSAFPYSGWNIDDVQFWGWDVEPDEGDLDGDSDVDLDDFSVLAACLSGPAVAAPSGCGRADLLGDGSVDLADFAYFQVLFAGDGD